MLADPLPEKTEVRRGGAMAGPFLIGVLLLGGVYLLVFAVWQLKVLGVCFVLLMVLEEVARRSTTAMNGGRIDARVDSGRMLFTSTRRTAWLGLAMLVVSVAGLLVFFPAIASLDASGSGHYRNPGKGLLGLLLVVEIPRSIWLAVRTINAAWIRVDEDGLVVGAPFRRRREFAWSELAYASASSKRFGVATRAGEVLAWNARWLRSDPTLVAEIVAQCIEDPGARARLGDETVDVMLAQERWNHRYDPASRFSGRGAEDGVER
ncbi:hypothetical protein [Microbacterium sp. 13-71-7]|uniref:hypothetical protein n=1 Tax=Microbacterium sp. 13-71-7 TaxID=1970399 RepID=UPI0026010A0C|nr:hypothetical protein [Microbacterium sp. 13-71-7]